MNFVFWLIHWILPLYILFFIVYIEIINISCIFLPYLHCSDFIYLCLTGIILGLLILVISFYAHDAVAASVSHKHHSIICVVAGLIQFVYGSHSRLATELILHKIPLPPFFSRAFLYNKRLTLKHWFKSYPLILDPRTLPSPLTCRQRCWFTQAACLMPFPCWIATDGIGLRYSVLCILMSTLGWTYFYHTQ